MISSLHCKTWHCIDSTIPACAQIYDKAGYVEFRAEHSARGPEYESAVEGLSYQLVRSVLNAQHPSQHIPINPIILDY